MSTLIANTLQGINTIKYDANTTAMTIDSSGRVALNPQVPMWRTELSGNQSLSANTWTQVNFNTIPTGADPDNAYNTSTYRYVAPVKGWYHISALCSINVNAANMLMYSAIKINGNFVSYNEKSESNDARWTHSIMEQLAVGDYVEVFVYVNNSNVIEIRGGGEESQFHGFLVRATA